MSAFKASRVNDNDSLEVERKRLMQRNGFNVRGEKGCLYVFNVVKALEAPS